MADPAWVERRDREQHDWLAWHREHDVLSGVCRKPGCYEPECDHQQVERAA